MCIYILAMRKGSVGNMQHKWHPSSKVQNETEDKSKHTEKKTPTPKIMRLSVCELVSLKSTQLLSLQC